MIIDLREIEKNLPVYTTRDLPNGRTTQSFTAISGSKPYKYEYAFGCDYNKSQALHNAIRQAKKFEDLPKIYQDKIIEIEEIPFGSL